jgi:segregation and condensation protein A|tara:strand:- start:7481 stop:8281 length:801 start_codon:yes stop_codon:yes gene_type:complete
MTDTTNVVDDNKAKVYGEPLKALPLDLYIPPDALEVYLDSFQGPLDLLLYLIRKNNIDILDIPMALLTIQYMEYVEKMKQIKLELAGDYLLMSAMLIEIKSRMLLPPIISEEDDDLDPRADLVAKLIEYELMKTAAHDLDDIPQIGRDRLVAQGYFEKIVEPQSLPDASIEDLFNAWKNVVKRAGQFESHKIDRSELSVREHMSLILKKLASNELILFDTFFNEEKDPIPKLVVCFLAILELTKECLIKINQQEPCSPIYIQRSGD